MTAFLPHQDPNPLRRERELSKARDAYQYNFSHVSPLALVDRVPIDDEFSFQWLATVAERVMVGLENMAALDMDADHRDHHLQKHKVFRNLLEAGAAQLTHLKTLVEDALRFNPRLGSPSDRPRNLDDYIDLFHHIGLPPVAKDFQDDKVFAWMRIAGPNSVMLQRMTAPVDHFPVTDEHFAQAIQHDSLAAALAEARLYLADYHLLDGAQCGSYPHGQKYVYAPLALFVVEKNSQQLLPVAIQCKQKPAPDNPIFTPPDGWNWTIAKAIVETADGHIHEAVTHLGRTHLFTEPFAVSMYRQIAPNHPLARLLAPHFEGTLAINEASWKHLIADKGAVDKLFGASIKATRELTATGVTSVNLLDAMLPKTFAAREVQDVDALPVYPYRDDTLLYWDAIASWVKDYLSFYYRTDQDVQGDHELQDWARELASRDGGRINGLGEKGISDIAALADTLTLIIYTCSVQHAAVNFPQYDLMSYTPNMPLAGYVPAPTDKANATEQDYLNMLPPIDMAELQMDLGYLLGTVHYTQLGKYGHEQFQDPRIAQPLSRFQHRLSRIGGTISERNRHRRPYTFLEPQGVPQSINI